RFPSEKTVNIIFWFWTDFDVSLNQAPFTPADNPSNIDGISLQVIKGFTVKNIKIRVGLLIVLTTFTLMLILSSGLGLYFLHRSNN
ncbi:hypothetical protein COJ96_26070, partial [Bacillus sp. AFS073361]